MANDQINVPSLVVILVLSGLIIRYLFFSAPAAAGGGPAGAGARDSSLSSLRQREAAVERIQQMFPQVDRRTVLWDLQRNGSNIAATTERILAGRLEAPPITFQPPPLPGSNTSSAQASTAARPVEKPAQPDLIQRYHLQDKVASSNEAAAPELATSSGSGSGKNKNWSSDKNERQMLLQKRREEMILAARRKMEAKMAAEKTAGGS